MATLRRGKKYRIRYVNGRGERSERVLHVRSVTSGAYGRTYVRGFCELAGEERTFRLDRMAGVELIGGDHCETTVTSRRNSSYGSGLASAAEAEPEPPKRSAGLTRFLLKAAALFVLFDFVLTDNPGHMSDRVTETVVDLVVSTAAVAKAESARPEAMEPEPVEPEPEPGHPDPEPVKVAPAATFGVSASRVREAELPEPPVKTAQAVRADRLARVSGVTDELVISRFDRADLNRDDELSWHELKRFQREVFRDFRYENNATALRPEEFFVAGGGDCEDFAIFSAAMLTYWGWEAYVASMGTSQYDAHAVVFVKVDHAPSWASSYEITAAETNPRFAAGGTFVPVDYDVVGGITNAVSPGSTVTDIVVPRQWYGLRI